MKLKNVLMVIGGFLAGVITTGIVAVKFVKTLLKGIAEHEILLHMVKDSWIDLFIKVLYGNTDGYIERKLREEGYARYKYRPTYTRYSDWKRNHPEWKDEEDEAWKKWRDNLERRMKESEEDE